MNHDLRFNFIFALEKEQRAMRFAEAKGNPNLANEFIELNTAAVCPTCFVIVTVFFYQSAVDCT